MLKNKIAILLAAVLALGVPASVLAAPAVTTSAPAPARPAVSSQTAGTEYKNAAGQTVYVVAQDDYLWKIARKYGITYQEIAAANSLTNANLIFVGQELIIPAAGQAAAPAVPAAPAAEGFYNPFASFPVNPADVIPITPTVPPVAPAEPAAEAPAEETDAGEEVSAAEIAEEDIPFEGGTLLRDVIITNLGGTIDSVETMEDGLVLVSATFNGSLVSISIDPVETYTGTVTYNDAIEEFGAYLNMGQTYILEDEFIAALAGVGILASTDAPLDEETAE